jgi:hypothetical protein
MPFIYLHICVWENQRKYYLYNTTEKYLFDYDFILLKWCCICSFRESANVIGIKYLKDMILHHPHAHYLCNLLKI